MLKSLYFVRQLAIYIIATELGFVDLTIPMHLIKYLILVCTRPESLRLPDSS